MTSRYAVTLGSVSMASLDDNLLITDVQYSPLERSIQKQTTANLGGYELSKIVVAQRKVTVKFVLRIYDIAKRNEVCQKVNAWAAAGGSLKTNDRANQFLTVACEQFAEIESALKWTEELTLVFTSTAIPYWQSVTAKSIAITGKNTSGTLRMDGNIEEALVSVDITAKATVKSLRLKVGSYQFDIKGFTAENGQKIVVDYVNNRYLRIRVNGKSVMDCLDKASSDLLKAGCGKNVTVSVVADNTVTAVFSARGLWI